MSKHTPGPWTLDGDGFVYGEGNIVADPHSSLNIDHDELDANARLIACAPELLEALKGIFKECQMIHTQWGEGCNAKEAKLAIKTAKAVIAKAEGLDNPTIV